MISVDPMLVARIPEALRDLKAFRPKKVVPAKDLATRLEKMGFTDVSRQLTSIAKGVSMKKYVEFLGGNNDPREAWVWGLPAPAEKSASVEDWKAA